MLCRLLLSAERKDGHVAEDTSFASEQEHFTDIPVQELCALRQATSPSASRPVRDYVLRWLICLLVVAVDGTGLWIIDIHVDEYVVRSLVVVDALLLTMGILIAIVGLRMTAARAVYGAVAEFLCSVPQAVSLSIAIAVTAYLGASLNVPVVDSQFAQFDAFFGLERSIFDLFLSQHPQVSAVLFFAYRAMIPAFLFLLVINSARGFGGNSELLWGFIISAIVTVAIAAVFPAIGYDGMIGHRHIAILESVRSGSWVALAPSNADGIVTFPSFHAALAVVMAYDARRSKFTALIVWPIATLIVISTPLCGGHYVADTVAGVIIALGAIMAIRAAGSEQQAAWLSTAFRAILGSRSKAGPQTESTP